ncbi:TetR/AcrR family transcriptional regulator [Saccharomonospora xinjiangensis]|uniref:TetR/AcrR family transcriptional regulator n=1 Tax=Saccharomonospora xinjiangensis TaxID=75294 RepID=UPI00030D8EDE|nr:TetR/AcrR family transcriptional regulator [Saccharomonospora xinjiangensis]
MGNRADRHMNPEKRRLLLETAAREFATSGYERASLNRIIRECRMSKSSFYYYVESKESLFDLVVKELTGELLDVLAIPEPEQFAADFWTNTADIFGRLTTLARERPLFADLGRLFHLPRAPMSPGSAAGAALAATRAWLDRVLAEGVAAGAVRDDLPLSLLREATVAVLAVFDDWTLRHRGDLDNDAAAALVRGELAALRGLLAPGPEERS